MSLSKKQWQSGTFNSIQNTFTSLEDELNKPLNGSDVATLELAKEEVRRLRQMIYSETKKNMMVEGVEGSAERLAEESAAYGVLRRSSLMYGHDEDHPSHAELDARNERKRVNKATMRKLKIQSNIARHDVLNIMKSSHQHAELVARSVTTSSIGASYAVAEDAHAHAANFIHTDYHEQEVAVLVSDLSGFTSTTRKYGIVHFASIIVRMRQLVLPIFSKYNALNINTEADNFITGEGVVVVVVVVVVDIVVSVPVPSFIYTHVTLT